MPKKLTLKEYDRMAEEDLAVDEDRLVSASLETPMLHGKWANFLAQEVYGLEQLNIKRKVMYKDLYDYYLRRKDGETYMNRPLVKLDITKTEAPMYIEADPDYVAIKDQISKKQLVVSRLEEILSAIRYRHTNVRNAVDYLKFQAGIHN